MSKFLSKSVLSFVMVTIFCCMNVVYADSGSAAEAERLPEPNTTSLAEEQDATAETEDRKPIPLCARLLNVLILGNDEKFNEFVVNEVRRLGERVENFDIVLESNRARELDLKKKTVITKSDVYHPFCFAIHCDIAESAGDARMRTCHYVLCPFGVKSEDTKEDVESYLKYLWDAIRDQNQYCEIQFIPIRGKDISPDDFKTMASGIGRLCTSLQSANFLRSQELKECLGRQAVGYMAVTDVKENELHCFLDYINSWGKLRVDDVAKHYNERKGSEEVLLDEETFFDMSEECVADEPEKSVVDVQEEVIDQGEFPKNKDSEEASEGVIISESLEVSKEKEGKPQKKKKKLSKVKKSTKDKKAQKKKHDKVTLIAQPPTKKKKSADTVDDQLDISKCSQLFTQKLDESYNLFFQNPDVKKAFIKVIQKLKACRVDVADVLSKIELDKRGFFVKRIVGFKLEDGNYGAQTFDPEACKDVDSVDYEEIYSDVILKKGTKVYANLMRICFACLFSLANPDYIVVVNSLKGFKCEIKDPVASKPKFVFSFGALSPLGE